MTTRMTAHFSLMTSIQCTIFLPEFKKIYAKKMEMLRIYIGYIYGKQIILVFIYFINAIQKLRIVNKVTYLYPSIYRSIYLCIYIYIYIYIHI